VLKFNTVIWTPGTTAPASSMTAPVRVAVADCARAVAVSSKTRSAAAASRGRVRRLKFSPREVIAV
jgi:hypothetical protein